MQDSLAKFLAATFALLILLSPVARAQAEQSILEGDQAWQQRAEGRQGTRAAPEPIGEAVAACEQALKLEPDSLEARWKLLRALYFQGEYVAVEPEEKLEVFAKGREIAERGIDQLAEALGGRERLEELDPAEVGERLESDEEAAHIFFWAAAHWGLWGRHRGKFAAAREGVASTIRDYAELSIALDETIQNGGGHRVLGRLHAEAPKIPFFTGWIDRKVAVRELERAVELAPQDLLSRLYLVEALLDFRPERQAEALELLRDLLERRPDPAWLIEDTRVLEDARALQQRLAE